MIEMFSFPFMQRAFLAGAMVGLVASYFGVFVVQRRMSFLGSGLSHAAFGGIALALLLDLEPLWGAGVFTVFVALGITWVQSRTKLAVDTAIGIFFAVSMALGVVFLSLRREYAADAFGYLFGDVLLLSRLDVMAAGALLLLLPATWPLWRRWAYATFDAELALSDRVEVERDNYLLAIALALTVVVAVKVVGIVLVAAFLVAPAATARLVSPTFAWMTLLSMLFGLVAVFVGLAASYRFDLPSGATIILVQSAGFFCALPFRRLFD